MNLLERTFYHNTVEKWIIALAVAAILLILLRVLKFIIHYKAKAFARKTKTDIDDLLVEVLRRTKIPFILVVSLYAGSHFLFLPETVRFIINKLMILGLLFQAVVWGNVVLAFWLERYKKQKKEEDAATLTAFAAIGFLAKLAIWSVALLLALDNLGIDITTLVAGLGIGGIAVALAVQNVLGDLFASMSIVLDRPFVIGDFIIVDNFMGTVEHIGLKTTRVRSLSGEQLIFANSDLLKSRIQNFKRMSERRVVFTIGVTYQTPAEKLASIPNMIREIIEQAESARFDRSHFKGYGDFSLNFETVYYVKTPDYTAYMDVQQEINLAIYRRFNKEGIAFAYPTQTIFLSKE